MAIADYITRYCAKCGHIDGLHIGDNCQYCGYILKNTEYHNKDVFDHGHLIPEMSKIIFERYIKDNPIYCEEAVENRKQRIRSIGTSSSSLQTNNKMTCPYCKSTNITKISTLNRAVSIGAFGLASGKVGKQWHCNGCKSDF